MNVVNTIWAVRKIMPQYLRRNRICLGDLNQRIPKNGVRLHYWHSHERENLGDYLSTVIVEHMKQTSGVAQENATNAHLYAVGSILQAGYQNAVVWGSGFIEDPMGSGLSKLFHSNRMRRLDVRAVRGPLTAEALRKLGHTVPEVYGDPGILMPMVYQPEKVKKTKKYVVVRHYVDQSTCEHTLPILTTDYKRFIDGLCQAERVISSSLHGIILAEAYGIPAVLYRPEGSDQQLPLFKYKDYYYGTGRMQFPVAGTIEEALELEPCLLPDFTLQAAALAAAFPVDLWQGEK